MVFGLTINPNIMRQGIDCQPSISIDGHILDVVDDYVYLGSNISSTLSLDREVSTRMGKAVAVMASLNERVWDNAHLTTKTKNVCTRPVS
jgi:hypothetical protein